MGGFVHPDQIHVWPWARSYETVMRNQNAVLFSAARTKVREDMFKWAGPILTLSIGLVAKKIKILLLTT